jgi:PmbA protein
MPVVFAKLGAMTLFLPLFNGFNGRQVFLGTSPLKGRLGERAFDRRFNLVDDGRLPYGTRSGAFDDEGSPAAERTLVEDGVVRSFLYDLKTARQAGTAPTGNGFRSNPSGRGYHLRPDVAPSTFRVRPGDTPLATILAGLDEALLVEQVMGLGTAGNPLTGDFSNTVATGFLVRRGEIVGRVKNTMVAGNVYELLAHALVAVGDQTEVVDDVAMSPPLVLDGVTVVSG